MKTFVKFLLMAVAVIITSLFYFPIQVRWFPALNTKMILAAIGLVLFAYDCAKNGGLKIEKDTIVISLLAVAVSLSGLISVVYNSTSDLSYSTYFVSFLVWLFGAYSVTFFIRAIHSGISVWLMVNYLIAASVFQCTTAIMIDSIPAFKSFVDSWLVGFGFTSLADVQDIGRLYGIGATLDVAGARFCPILTSIAVLYVNCQDTQRERYRVLYLISFFMITVIGCMMGRTATVGAVLGIVIMLLPWGKFNNSISYSYIRRIMSFGGVLVFLVCLCVILYRTNPQFHDNIRFAFEGFFSLAETGEWHVSSNDRLANMVVWPESLKTWIIGDGYFEGAANDPNFIGNAKMKSYYMWTDIGYLRFIFYFGVIGLLSFITYFIKCAVCCMKRFYRCGSIFIIALVLNLAIWFKVATDIFLFFALFLCIHQEEHEGYESKIFTPNYSINE